MVPLSPSSEFFLSLSFAVENFPFTYLYLLFLCWDLGGFFSCFSPLRDCSHTCFYCDGSKALVRWLPTSGSSPWSSFCVSFPRSASVHTPQGGVPCSHWASASTPSALYSCPWPPGTWGGQRGGNVSSPLGLLWDCPVQHEKRNPTGRQLLKFKWHWKAEDKITHPRPAQRKPLVKSGSCFFCIFSIFSNMLILLFLISFICCCYYFLRHMKFSVKFTVSPHAATITATPSSPHDNMVSAQLLVESPVSVYVTRTVYLFLSVDPGVILWSGFYFRITFSFLDVETLVFFLLLCFFSVLHQICRQWSVLFVSVVYFAFVSGGFSALSPVWAFWVWYIWGYLSSTLITDW